MRHHVLANIWNEMAERNWTPNELARRMSSDARSFSQAQCALDALFNIDDPRLTMGHEMAEDLGHAFGTGAEFWLNLEQAATVSANRAARCIDGTGGLR